MRHPLGAPKGKIMKWFGVLLIFTTSVLFAQSIDSIAQHQPHSSGTVRVLIGFGRVYGAHVGGSVHIIRNCSFEISVGKNSDFNFAGPSYAMTTYGFGVNEYLFEYGSSALFLSLLVSRANVTKTSADYAGDFTYVAPMVGIDLSYPSGFGSYIRFGPTFATENYKQRSPVLSVDIGLSFSFN
jgi:hypothetical protein